MRDKYLQIETKEERLAKIDLNKVQWQIKMYIKYASNDEK